MSPPLVSNTDRIRAPLRAAVEHVAILMGAARVTQLKVQEETMTEVLLAFAGQFAGPDLSVTAFTKQEEGATTGADWEWWWGGASGWFGMRVQAKRVKNKELPKAMRPGFDFVQGKGEGKPKGHQNGLLIADAEKAGVVPMYVLFDDEVTPPSPPVSCPASIHNDALAHRAGIMSAYVVRDVFSDFRASRDTCALFSRPLPCILCDRWSSGMQLGANPGLADAVAAAVLRMATDRQDVSDERRTMDAALRSDAPARVQSVINGEPPEEDVPLRSAGIVVIRDGRD